MRPSSVTTSYRLIVLVKKSGLRAFTITWAGQVWRAGSGSEGPDMHARVGHTVSTLPDLPSPLSATAFCPHPCHHHTPHTSSPCRRGPSRSAPCILCPCPCHPCPCHHPRHAHHEPTPHIPHNTHHVEKVPPRLPLWQEAVVGKAHHAVGVMIIAIGNQQQLLARLALVQQRLQQRQREKQQQGRQQLRDKYKSDARAG